MSILFYFPVQAQQKTNYNYVNPFIGTTKSGVLTHWGGDGGTYPGAVSPSGFIQISPETRVTGARGYNYNDSSIYYFSCLNHHSGFPEGSAGQVYIMPVSGTKPFEPGKYHRSFTHQNEVALPGYYRIKFSEDQVITEATTTLRSGLIRFTFPAKTIVQVFVGNTGNINPISSQIIHASLRNKVINFSEVYISKKQVNGGYLFTFKASGIKSKIVELKMSTSSVDFNNAQNNIDKEIENQPFETIKQKAKLAWEKQLSTVDITDKNEHNKTVFYTALYHSSLIPWVISDVDGRYRGEDGQVHRAVGNYQYGGFSPWDTFRSLHPLLSLLYPQKQNDIILSMLDIYKQTGHLPTETMTGNHAIPIIVDAYLKGINGFDKELAYKAMKSNIVDSPFVQSDMELYHRMNYVPYSRSESVTRTVEYAYDDWALAQYANLAMHNNDDYELLQKRGLNYRNLFYPQSLFLLPRLGDSFKTNPGMVGYKEGDQWVYSYFVPHNPKDLINLMGGNEAFSNRLDSALSSNVILFDNETVIHLPYLFNAAERPDLTQKWCRYIMQQRYKNTPEGLPGNDDLGAMSSAYIFNALGIFPVSPGRAEYSIGSPLFGSVKLHLANGKVLIINSDNQSPANCYVSSLTFNGKAYDQLSIPHQALSSGGMLHFKMTTNKSNWPANKNPLVLSETKESVNITITSSSLQKLTVVPNEQLWYRFTLKNDGATGTQNIQVYANGKPVASKNCFVSGGETLTDSISCRLYQLGKTIVRLNQEEKLNVQVIEPIQAGLQPFEVSAMQLKPMIKKGEEQKLSYTIKNITGTAQSFHIPLKLTDSLIHIDEVSLNPGESKIQQYQFVDQKKGLKYLHINTLKERYKVFDKNTEALLLDLPLQTKGSQKPIIDASGFGNDAHIITSGSKSPIVNQHILLGDDCYLEVPNAPNLDKLGKTITMMTWVYPMGNERGLTDMLTKGDTHVLQMNDNKTLTFFAGGWGRGDCTVNLPADWKQHWHHIAGVCLGSQLLVYIDGKLAGTSTVEGAPNLSVNNKWQIGRNEEFPSERIFHGYMDNVKVFSQPLSAQDISEIFNQEKTDHQQQP